MDREAAAEAAFRSYLFGPNVRVAPATGWAAGQHEWLRLAVVHLASSDSSPQTLQFRVRFAPGSNVVCGAFALDEQGCIVGQRSDAQAISLSRRALAAGQALEMHRQSLGCAGDHVDQFRSLLRSLAEWGSSNGIDVAAEMRAQFSTGLI